MRTITTDISISAPADRVWEILMDFDAYGEWNPFITSIEGTPAVGEQLATTLTLPGGKTMSFKPKVAAVESERFFQWLGKVGFKGIFDGRHSFRISPTEHGVRFEHSEQFTGVLAWMMGGSMGRRTEEGFEAMNAALKERSEA